MNILKKILEFIKPNYTYHYVTWEWKYCILVKKERSKKTKHVLHSPRNPFIFNFFWDAYRLKEYRKEVTLETCKFKLEYDNYYPWDYYKIKNLKNRIILYKIKGENTEILRIGYIYGFDSDKNIIIEILPTTIIRYYNSVLNKLNQSFETYIKNEHYYTENMYFENIYDRIEIVGMTDMIWEN